jgi:hypothetical protein
MYLQNRNGAFLGFGHQYVMKYQPSEKHNLIGYYDDDKIEPIDGWSKREIENLIGKGA